MNQVVPGPVPARVLVKGASSALAVVPIDGPRSHMNFARQLEYLLPAGGLPVSVRNHGGEGQTIHKALCDWAGGEYVWAPDVIILNLGMYECCSLFLPQPFERHTNNRHQHPGWLRQRYRDRVLKPGWVGAAKLQNKIQTAIGPANERRNERSSLELIHLARQMRAVGQPLVLVADLWTPAPPWTTWFSGLTERAKTLNETLRAAVAQMGDPGVRMFELGRVVDAFPPEIAVPDGMHFSVEVHGAVAIALAEVILDWASCQEHLQHP